MNKENLIFLGITLAALALVFEPLRGLINSGPTGNYSHIVLIPLVSAYFLYTERKGLLGNPSPSFRTGCVLVIVALALYLMGFTQNTLNQNDRASLLAFSAVVFWIGGYLAVYGVKSFRREPFPFLFLVFMIPIPSFVLDKIIYALQVGSTEMADLMFAVSGVPYNRQGFVFNLPRISVEVAEVCSGIRSSLALFITSILAGHFFLDKFWKKVVLALIVFPVTVFKNGIRILTLSLLGNYVDERWLTQSSLHHSGGFVFFIPGLIILGLVLWGLRRADKGPKIDSVHARGNVLWKKANHRIR